MSKQDVLDLKLWVKKSKLIRTLAGGLKKTGWYGRVVTNGVAGYEKLAERASKHTTVHKAEIKMGFEICIEEAAELLKQGVIIDLGPLGKLYPSCTSPWVEDQKELKLKDINLKINYKPSKELTEFFSGTTKYWYSEKDSSTGTGSTEDPDDVTEIIDNNPGTIDSSTLDTSTGSNNSGGDDIPSGNG